MIQDIHPMHYNNQYQKKQPQPNSVILLFDGDKVLCRYGEGHIYYPKYGEYKDLIAEYIYLFAIDDVEYFWVDTKEIEEHSGYSFQSISVFRTTRPKHQAFAGVCAYQLYCWYRDNRFCGRCGRKMTHDHKERMLSCVECNNSVYPKISPGVIVAVTDGNRLLMTKYAGREYKKYALIAGFSEIGESAEKTVEREVLEEVGLKVKNIRYYNSQPWSFSGSLLLGFFAEVDGDTKITLDEDELSEAAWVSREEILLDDNEISLTREMMAKYKCNQFEISKINSGKCFDE